MILITIPNNRLPGLAGTLKPSSQDIQAVFKMEIPLQIFGLTCGAMLLIINCAFTM